MGQGIGEGDVQSLGHGQRDAPVDERDVEPLRQAGTDLAPGSPVGGGQRDERHLLSSSHTPPRRRQAARCASV